MLLCGYIVEDGKQMPEFLLVPKNHKESKVSKDHNHNEILMLFLKNLSFFAIRIHSPKAWPGPFVHFQRPHFGWWWRLCSPCRCFAGTAPAKWIDWRLLKAFEWFEFILWISLKQPWPNWRVVVREAFSTRLEHFQFSFCRSKAAPCYMHGRRTSPWMVYRTRISWMNLGRIRDDKSVHSFSEQHRYAAVCQDFESKRDAFEICFF